MPTSPPVLALALALVAACSGGAGDGDGDDIIDVPVDGRVDAPTGIDGPPVRNPGFVTPLAVTRANVNTNGDWTEVGDADWTCLGTASSDQPSTGTIALSGTARDFQTGNGVGNATVIAWSTAPGFTVGTATSSDVTATRGQYAMTLEMLPAGTRRYSFSLFANSYVTTRVLSRYYPPGAAATDDLVMMSEATALALPAFVGVERDVTKVVYLGTMLDCQDRHVSNAVAGISYTPSTFDDAGGVTFYFSGGTTSLPVRHSIEPVMNNDGLFTVLDISPSASLYVQVWGFKDAAGLSSGTLTLLGEMLTPGNANETVTMTLPPRRT